MWILSACVRFLYAKQYCLSFSIHFQIDAGLQEVPTEWTVSVSPEVTDLVSPGETRAITIEVTRVHRFQIR